MLPPKSFFHMQHGSSGSSAGSSPFEAQSTTATLGTTSYLEPAPYPVYQTSGQCPEFIPQTPEVAPSPNTSDAQNLGGCGAWAKPNVQPSVFQSVPPQSVPAFASALDSWQTAYQHLPHDVQQAAPGMQHPGSQATHTGTQGPVPSQIAHYSHAGLQQPGQTQQAAPNIAPQLPPGFKSYRICKGVYTTRQICAGANSEIWEIGEPSMNGVLALLDTSSADSDAPALKQIRFSQGSHVLKLGAPMDMLTEERFYKHGIQKSGCGPLVCSSIPRTSGHGEHRLEMPRIPIIYGHVDYEDTYRSGLQLRGLVMDRIPAIPRTIVEAYNKKTPFCTDGVPILIRPFLGKHSFPDSENPEHQRSNPLEIPMSLEQALRIMDSDNLLILAGRMGVALSYLHWAARLDGAGTKFLLGGIMDSPKENTELFLLGFKRCRGLTSWTKESIVKDLIPAAVALSDYIPWPQPITEKGHLPYEMWDRFQTAYLDQSRVHLAIAAGDGNLCGLRPGQHANPGKSLSDTAFLSALELPTFFIEKLKEAFISPEDLELENEKNNCGKFDDEEEVNAPRPGYTQQAAEEVSELQEDDQEGANWLNYSEGKTSLVQCLVDSALTEDEKRGMQARGLRNDGAPPPRKRSKLGTKSLKIKNPGLHEPKHRTKEPGPGILLAAKPVLSEAELAERKDGDRKPVREVRINKTKSVFHFNSEWYYRHQDMFEFRRWTEAQIASFNACIKARFAGKKARQEKEERKRGQLLKA